jgi:hypothetical protein
VSPSAAPNPKVLWIGFLIAPLAYLGLVLTGALGSAVVGSNPGVIVPVLVGVAVLEIILSRYLRSKFTGDPQKRVLLWATDESVSILGLILYFMGAPLTAWLPLIVAGLILLLLDAPSRLPSSPDASDTSGAG